MKPPRYIITNLKLGAIIIALAALVMLVRWVVGA
jgi:hypothetical protein